MKRILFFLLILICQRLEAQERIHQELDSLANSLELEFVYGNRFPLNNPYGSFGSPAVLNFINSSEKSVLFLCRKKNKFHHEKAEETVLDLVRHYDYFLVFALKLSNDKYKVCDIISKGVGLKGMFLYYGTSDFQLSEFRYIDKPDEMGPQGLAADFSNGCVPIVISSDTVTSIYYYNDGRWLEYTERFN